MAGIRENLNLCQFAAYGGDEASVPTGRHAPKCCRTLGEPALLIVQGGSKTRYQSRGMSLADRITWRFKVPGSTLSGLVLNRISGISNFER
jgi:hypothetical protein